MSGRARAWYWVIAALAMAVIEGIVSVLWPRWFFLIRDSHWPCIAIAAYYFGLPRGSSCFGPRSTGTDKRALGPAPGDL
jgi:hypothetical protein